MGEVCRHIGKVSPSLRSNFQSANAAAFAQLAPSSAQRSSESTGASGSRIQRECARHLLQQSIVRVPHEWQRLSLAWDFIGAVWSLAPTRPLHDYHCGRAGAGTCGGHTCERRQKALRPSIRLTWTLLYIDTGISRAVLGRYSCV